MKVLTTFGFGDHAPFVEATAQTLVRYAARHGYDLAVPSVQTVLGIAKAEAGDWPGLAARPPSWWKLPWLRRLAGSYDRVVWLDADVCVCRFDRDILDDLAGDVGVVVHRVPDGHVPNCGVWVMTDRYAQTLSDLWSLSHPLHCWWEQAAFMRSVGLDPDVRPVPAVPLPPGVTALPYEWNPHVRDTRGIPADARFRHATQFLDREAVLWAWAGVALRGN